jgi:glycosyltransferase involved in cell wall biosynthesis
MRIACIANGDNIHALRWVNYFASMGHEVHLICCKDMEGYEKNVQIHLLTRLLPVIWPLSKYVSFLLWIFQARRFIRKIEPDIFEGLYATVWGFIAACSGFHPFSLCAQGSDILIDPKQNLLQRWLVKYSLKKADVILYDSETLKRGLLELGSDPDKLWLVLNGVNTQKFSPEKKNGSLRERLGVTGSPLVICFREFRPVYNVEMVVKAIPLVLSQLPEAKFILGGDGELREQLETLASDLGVTDSVRFTGYIPYDEVPGYLASADVYVSTSLSDSTSLSLQEAMACGLAPVVTDLPANQEWIVDGENGFLVPVGDIQTLADKVTYLLKNDELRWRFGKLGRELVQAKAEYQKEMGKLEELYQGVIQQQPRAGGINLSNLKKL